MTATVLRAGWVLGEDGTTRPGLDVGIEGGQIVAVGPSLQGDQVIDLAGCTVMPGLIDAHVHLAMAGPVEPDVTQAQSQERVARNARALLEAGVTTARDVSGPAEPLLAQRERCAQDPGAGPQLLVCCEGIATVDGHGTEFAGSAKIVSEVDGPEQARQAVRRLKQIGADWVKVMLNGADDQLELTEDELRAIVEEAQLQTIPVAAHASNPKAVALAVRCGVDSIEHGNDIDDDLAAQMVSSGIALVTTTYVYRAGAGCAHSHGGPGLVDPLIAFEPRVREQVRSILAARVAGHEQALPAAVRAGVRVVVGTDAVVGPIGMVADELRELVVLGLTPAEALRAATAAGAELLRLPDRGRIAEGLRADLLLVRGRPDEDLGTLGAPVLVMRGGAIVVDNR